MTTSVLADDHALVREGLRTILGGEDDWSVVGEANDGLEAVALVARLQPNVLIVDLMLPGLSGLEVIRQVRERVAQTQVVVLSMHANESYAFAALDSYETLTTREREVLHLAAQGETTPAIAVRLVLSPRTVETHRTNLMRKLGLRTHTDVIRPAMPGLPNATACPARFRTPITGDSWPEFRRYTDSQFGLHQA